MKLERQHEDWEIEGWEMVHSHIDRSEQDVSLCDMAPGRPYLLRATAYSDAGSTVALYKVALPILDFQGKSL